MINTANGDIVLDCWIKTHDGWVPRVDFLWASNEEKAVSAMTPFKRNMNNLHVEYGHPCEATTRATAKSLCIQVTSKFKTCED